MKVPELLAPAGGMEAAIAAINAGADALYLGGKNFSARSAAQNFDDEAIIGLIQYAAVRNVRIFVAVNTLYKNHEIPQVLEFANNMYRAGAAAFILQDAGLAYILKTHLPQAEIHASTQMTVHSTAGVHFMERMGFSRVVLARELSLAEVAEINAAANIECEVFVHGALCVSYSGQCLMSSLIGGRSGNRGKCAQICRTKFSLGEQSGYLLSPKDMMTLEILDEIVATGVSALKIEGRMKSPEYVYLVTKAYRDRLNNLSAPVPEKTAQNLLQIFNRGGSFCTGYYKNRTVPMSQTPKSTGVLAGSVVSYKNGKCKIKLDKEVNPGDGIEIWTVSGQHVGTGISKRVEAGGMLEVVITGAVEKGCAVYKSYDKGLVDAARKAIATEEKRVAIAGAVRAVAGERLRLTLTAGDITVEKTGGLVETAQNSPMSADEIIAQLSKTGGTPFVIEFADVHCSCVGADSISARGLDHAPKPSQISDNIFISKSALNQLRRDALAELEAKIKNNVTRVGATVLGRLCSHGVESRRPGAGAPTINLSIQLHNPAHLNTALSANVSRIYINILDFSPAIPTPQNTELFLTLPNISRNATEAKFNFSQLETGQFHGYLVSTYGQLQLLQAMKTSKKIMLNHSFNIFNNHALQFFASMDVAITLSQELNLHEIKAMLTLANTEIIAYGRQTLMTTHNCPIKCRGDRPRSPAFSYTLTDKLGAAFPILTDCRNCTAHILNSKTLDTSPKFESLKNTAATSFRLIFTTEDEDTIRDTISRYQQAMQGQYSPHQNTEFTYGHFFRGVE